MINIDQSSAWFPDALKQIAGTPKQLYALGEVGLLVQPKVALVGSRRASKRGLKLAADLTETAVESGWVTVSGLARGIDTVVHQATLASGGQTIAVLAHGLDIIYPPENKTLAEQIIAKRGLLLSELPPGTPPRRDLFVARNRIVVGLSSLLVVVEAQLRSGSLSSATHAADQGQDVLAIPGSPGTDLLIEEGATPIESVFEFKTMLAQSR